MRTRPRPLDTRDQRSINRLTSNVEQPTRLPRRSRLRRCRDVGTLLITLDRRATTTTGEFSRFSSLLTFFVTVRLRKKYQTGLLQLRYSVKLNSFLSAMSLLNSNPIIIYIIIIIIKQNYSAIYHICEYACMNVYVNSGSSKSFCDLKTDRRPTLNGCG